MSPFHLLVLPPPSLPARLEDGEEKQLDLREHGRAAQQHARGDGSLNPGEQREERKWGWEGRGGEGMVVDGCANAMKWKTGGATAPWKERYHRHQPEVHPRGSLPPAPPPPCQWQLFSSVPLEDDRAADEDAHQQDHGPDGRKGMRVRRGRGLALRKAGRDDQG